MSNQTLFAKSAQDKRRLAAKKKASHANGVQAAQNGILKAKVPNWGGLTVTSLR